MGLPANFYKLKWAIKVINQNNQIRVGSVYNWTNGDELFLNWQIKVGFRLT